MPTPLSWPDCRNVRDLGGLPTTDGFRVRSNALIRADSLERLTPEGVTIVKAAGMRRIVDLRNVAEAGAHPFSADASLYRLIPLIDPAREPSRNRSAEQTLADIYRSSLVRNARSIVEGVAAIADAPDGPVVVHCAVGKDRTGMTVALALSVAGVSDEDIAADYAESERCLQADFATWLAEVTDEAHRRRVTERMSCRPETILAFLEHARKRFGSVAGYLTEHYMEADLLERLRLRLREPQ